MKEIISKVQDYIKENFPIDTTGHDWHHIFRVRDMALKLQIHEGGDVELIELGALLHDVSDHKFNGGKLDEGGNVAFQLLLDFGCSEEIALKVKDIVNSTSFKGAKVADKTNSLEAKIVQDADRLDAIGAIGIARTFAYGSHAGNPIFDPEIQPEMHDSFEKYVNAKTHTINHFHEKLLLLTDMLHTETAKEIGSKRHQIMEDFLTEFHKEWNINID